MSISQRIAYYIIIIILDLCLRSA